MNARLACAAILLASPAAAAEPGIWKSCRIDSVSECSAAGCSARKPTISIFVSDFVDRGVERAAYYRCGIRLSNCDRYSALAYRTGDFMIFSLPQRSVFAKLGTDERITDVAAVGDDVLVSRGTCTTAVPPPAASLRSQ